MQILECAIAFGMPKLLACCECYMAADDQDRFKTVSSTLLPLSSTLRIAEGLRGLKRKASEADYGDRCECYCCQNSRDNGEHECECYRMEIPDGVTSTWMPSPNEFLSMAQR